MFRSYATYLAKGVLPVAGLALREPLPRAIGKIVLPIALQGGHLWVAGKFSATNKGRSHERGLAP